MKTIIALVGIAAISALNLSAQSEHFDPKGKPPSEHTIAKLNQARAELPFADTRDFDEQKKGFIAAPESKKIMADAGNVAWDLDRFEFLLENDEFDSIHPSLVRQSLLNMNYGLYEVIPGIYQVRGFDLSNVTSRRGLLQSQAEWLRIGAHDRGRQVQEVEEFIVPIQRCNDDAHMAVENIRYDAQLVLILRAAHRPADDLVE